MGVVSEAPDIRRPFSYELKIRAPALNDYSIAVLSIHHDLHMYPLTVRAELREGGPTIECRDEEGFLTSLKEIFQSVEVRKAISALHLQSNASLVLNTVANRGLDY